MMHMLSVGADVTEAGGWAVSIASDCGRLYKANDAHAISGGRCDRGWGLGSLNSFRLWSALQSKFRIRVSIELRILLSPPSCQLAHLFAKKNYFPGKMISWSQLYDLCDDAGLQWCPSLAVGVLIRQATHYDIYKSQLSKTQA